MPRRGCKHLRPGDWLDTLHALAGQGVPDGRIAVELSRRNAPLRFSRRQVWYWRTQPLRQDPDMVAHFDIATASDARRWQERAYQVRQGWGHLLPAERPWPENGWTSGHELRPQECDLLSVLRDDGPLTARQLAHALGLRRRRPASHRRDLLAGLCRAGLVVALRRESRGPFARPLVYALAGPALCQVG